MSFTSSGLCLPCGTSQSSASTFAALQHALCPPGLLHCALGHPQIFVLAHRRYQWTISSLIHLPFRVGLWARPVSDSQRQMLYACNWRFQQRGPGHVVLLLVCDKKSKLAKIIIDFCIPLIVAALILYSLHRIAAVGSHFVLDSSVGECITCS